MLFSKKVLDIGPWDSVSFGALGGGGVEGLNLVESLSLLTGEGLVGEMEVSRFGDSRSEKFAILLNLNILSLTLIV